MVYYDQNGIVIRDLRRNDAQILTEEELAQGWDTTVDKFETRLRHQRGYIPDGSGVWYKDRVCEPYRDCCNDDDLVLYLSKHKK